MSKQTGPQGGFDVATHAAVTGGEVITIPNNGTLVVGYCAALPPKPLRSRLTAEAEAWRDGWRAAMACAVLVAETARAPAAVDLLREQMEPPV